MSEAAQAAESNGGQGRNRTSDTRIFSAVLYQLSYLASCACLGGVQKLEYNKGSGSGSRGSTVYSFQSPAVLIPTSAVIGLRKTFRIRQQITLAEVLPLPWVCASSGLSSALPRSA